MGEREGIMLFRPGRRHMRERERERGREKRRESEMQRERPRERVRESEREWRGYCVDILREGGVYVTE